jgi:hypothetical protein
MPVKPIAPRLRGGMLDKFVYGACGDALNISFLDHGGHGYLRRVEMLA